MIIRLWPYFIEQLIWLTVTYRSDTPKTRHRRRGAMIKCPPINENPKTYLVSKSG